MSRPAAARPVRTVAIARSAASLVVLAAALGLGAAGCHGQAHCPAGTRSSFELRDSNGFLEVAIKGTAMCDGQLRKLGELTNDPNGVSLRDAAGKPLMSIAREDDHVAHLTTPVGEKLRLFKSDKEMRVLTPDGVPFGTIVREPRLATLYNPSQSPIGRILPRDPDAVLTDLSGTTLAYIVPSRDLHAAGAFGIQKLDRSEQLLIYLYWSR